MELTFLGAAHEVTGSCTLLTAGGKNILIDCGLEQGQDTFVNSELPVNPTDIDCVLLTHAHIDHSGRLPLLYKNGFTGSIYATEATCNLCRVMLLDSAHIQMMDTEWKNRKAKRAGLPPEEPIYTTEDAQGAISKLVPCVYGEMRQILENVRIRFNDIGHLLGSSCIEVWVSEKGIEKKIVFSGDVGNIDQPIIKDPVRIKNTDYLVIESTYGDRLHEARPDHIGMLTAYIQKTLDRGGNVVIPSFAVGRTQEILYFIREIKDRHLVSGHDGFPVYIDSPLANEATGIFLQCPLDCFDEETRALIAEGINPLYFDDLKAAVTEEDSKAINFDSTPKVIISASGMCEGGRIRHHLKHNIWDKRNLILFVGYQAVGTLGRTIYDGAKKIKILGEEIAVQAEIEMLPGISGHADKQGLINWLSGFEKKPAHVFVNHGEDGVCTAFAECLKNEYGYNVDAPYSGSVYDLAADMPAKLTTGIPAEKRVKIGGSRADSLFARLIAAAERLLDTVKDCKGRSNKDIAKYASQIDSLTDRIKNN